MFLLLQVYIVTDDSAEDEWTATARELGMLRQLSQYCTISTGRGYGEMCSHLTYFQASMLFLQRAVKQATAGNLLVYRARPYSEHEVVLVLHARI